MNTTKKITLATVKSFIKKAGDSLHILTSDRFDGTQDMVCSTGETEFSKAIKTEFSRRNLGVCGAFFVGGDRFEKYAKGQFDGILVYNCCGSFILATKTA